MPTQSYQPSEEMQELVWALVDDYIEPPQVARIEELVCNDTGARRTYVECMQLHSDLYFYFNGDKHQQRFAEQLNAFVTSHDPGKSSADAGAKPTAKETKPPAPPKKSPGLPISYPRDFTIGGGTESVS